MWKRLRLNDVFSDWKIGKGIFYYMSSLISLKPPWIGSVNSMELDLVYHGNNSGQKYLSTLIKNIVDYTTYPISDADANMIAECVMSMYYDNWTRLWQALQTEYNPIDNYNMKEEMSDNKTVRTYGKTNIRTDNLKQNHSGADTQTPISGQTTEHSTQGFNSSTYSPASKDVVTNQGTASNNYNSSYDNTGTQKYEDGGEDTDVNSYVLTRAGNIGVTTSQQMLESEFNFRKRNYFRDIVFPDLDKILTLSIY